MQPIIECIDIGRSFISKNILGKKTETTALHNINLCINPGIIFGLLGPNGAGKTTLIRILCTLLNPTSGRAFLAGHDVTKEATTVRKNIGLILGGDRGFYGRLTGTENLRYFAVMNGLSRSTIRERVSELIKTVGLDSAKDMPVDHYSRGMKQRLHIARGLVTHPRVLFMDEPTIGLDPIGAQSIRELVPKLVNQGISILLTTHYMFEVDELCEQIAIINEGRLLVTGTSKEIKKEFSNVEIYEIVVRQDQSHQIQKIQTIQGIERVIVGTEGPFQKITLHVNSKINIGIIRELIGQNNLESCIQRSPNMEEAYLNIISKPQSENLK